MSEPINANPTVLEISDLPTRKVDQGKETTDLQGYDDGNRLGNKIGGNIFSNDDNDDDDDYYTLITRDPSPGLVSDHSSSSSEEEDEQDRDIIDPQEIYDLIATISDPEHPLTLGQLAVVQLNDIRVEDNTNSSSLLSYVYVDITPTITHCSLATLIGLGIRVRLERSLPPRFRIHINVKPGSHQSQDQVNRQLNDKERVAAACENQQLVGVIENMLATCK